MNQANNEQYSYPNQPYSEAKEQSSPFQAQNQGQYQDLFQYPDYMQEEPPPQKPSALKYLAIALAAVLVVVGLYFLYTRVIKGGSKNFSQEKKFNGFVHRIPSDWVEHSSSKSSSEGSQLVNYKNKKDENRLLSITNIQSNNPFIDLLLAASGDYSKGFINLVEESDDSIKDVERFATANIDGKAVEIYSFHNQVSGVDYSTTLSAIAESGNLFVVTLMTPNADQEWNQDFHQEFLKTVSLDKDVIQAASKAIAEKIAQSETPAESESESKELLEAALEEQQESTETEPDYAKLIDQVEENTNLYYATYGNYSYAISIIENKSDYPVSVSAKAKFLSAGEQIGDSDGELVVLGSKEKSIIRFSTENIADDCEVTLSVSRPKYEEGTSDIEMEVSDVGENVVITLTNNGEDPSQFLKAYALFYYQDQLVNSDDKYFVDANNNLEPGESITQELQCLEPYDEYEIYLDGRSSRPR